MEESDHTTRMGTLRRELEQERVERTTLENKVAELQQVIEELQLLKTKNPSEEDGSEDESPPSPEDLRAEEGRPSDQEGLPHLISLYGSALHDSKNIQKVSLEKPEKFSGTELEDSPYALTYWYRDVLCWCQAYAFNRPKEQLVLAINQALSGMAKAMVQNLITREPTALVSVEDLYNYLKKTFQNQDPGPEACCKFHTARMKRTENVLQFLNRLVQLSFVVNASSSPVCHTLTEYDISARLQHGLPGHLQRALYKHLDHLIEVDKTPDMEPGNLAAIIFKLEGEVNETPRREVRQPASSWKVQSSEVRNVGTVRNFHKRSNMATAAALPSAQPNSLKMNVPARQERKRFDELDEEQQDSIKRVQTKLASRPLGAKLCQEERDLCLSHSPCLRCRHYGHDQAACKMASVMGAPKN